MADKVLEIEGLDELMDAWEKLPEEALSELKEAMEKATALLWDILVEYPPATDANRPGRTNAATGRPMGFYERGAGWWRPVMQRATLGVKPLKRAGMMTLRQAGPVAGLGAMGVAGYKLRKTSQDLKESWTTQVTSGDGWIVGEVGTDTSYAPWLVDDEKQAQRMAQIGWKTAGKALGEVEADIDALFEQAVKKALETLNTQS